MIHELVVSLSESPKELRKRARKLAMTGGYEVSLAVELSRTDLEKLVEIYRDELNLYEPGSAAFQSSLAGRILGLVAQHPLATKELQVELQSELESRSEL